ncbi:hypothetical protein Q4602_19420 [Paraglaciecola chathamensis]|uniref:hypothetical protein n=1 Tax=Paraglaciecola chathamensis TaxID=368405 RepID=UPI00270E8E76|nr:hypothetical protein [Paraglaciecola chathamensis]MDO6841661.1 hypothetical protein [Paraglaciecola chathamensis]
MLNIPVKISNRLYQKYFDAYLGAFSPKQQSFYTILRMAVSVSNGTQELFEAGDVFYAQPGHTAIVDKDLKFIDFSPTKELAQVMSNVDKVMAEMA